MKTISDVLWYLDPHREAFLSRSIVFKDFKEFQGYNDWKQQKRKKPRVCIFLLTIYRYSLIGKHKILSLTFKQVCEANLQNKSEDL